MGSRRRNHQQHSKLKSHDEEWPERMTVAQAHKFLGVSHAKMTQLLCQDLIPAQRNPIDMRKKVIKRSDLEAFLKEYRNS
jgi:hypothetical protein